MLCIRIATFDHNLLFLVVGVTIGGRGYLLQFPPPVLRTLRNAEAESKEKHGVWDPGVVNLG